MNLVVLAVFAWRGQVRVVLRAKRDALIGLPGMWKKRRLVQNKRKVSLRAMLRVLDKRFNKFFW